MIIINKSCQQPTARPDNFRNPEDQGLPEPNYVPLKPTIIATAYIPAQQRAKKNHCRQRHIMHKGAGINTLDGPAPDGTTQR